MKAEKTEEADLDYGLLREEILRQIKLRNTQEVRFLKKLEAIQEQFMKDQCPQMIDPAVWVPKDKDKLKEMNGMKMRHVSIDMQFIAHPTVKDELLQCFPAVRTWVLDKDGKFLHRSPAAIPLHEFVKLFEKSEDQSFTTPPDMN